MWPRWDWSCIGNNVSSSRRWTMLLPISVLENHNQGLFTGRSVFCRVSAYWSQVRCAKRKKCQWVVGGGDEINTVFRAAISQRFGSLRRQKFLKLIFFFLYRNQPFVQISRLTEKKNQKSILSGVSYRPAVLSFSLHCCGSGKRWAFPTLRDAARRASEIDFSTRSRKKEMTARQIKFFVSPFIGKGSLAEATYLSADKKTPIRANLSAEAEQQLGGGY